MSPAREFAELRPFGGFDLIMADPPWHFDTFSAKGEARAPQAHYETQGLDWIKALPIQALAADNCLLWLWACNPMLPQAIEVLTAWGFTFKTAGTWVKRTAHGKVAFGTGYVLRSANEPFLIGTIGRPKTTRGTRSAIMTPMLTDLTSTAITIEAMVREHSRKPDAAFDAAEQLIPEARRLELFSRQARPGWSVWGNEINKFEKVAP